MSLYYLLSILRLFGILMDAKLIWLSAMALLMVSRNMVWVTDIPSLSLYVYSVIGLICTTFNCCSYRSPWHGRICSVPTHPGGLCKAIFRLPVFQIRNLAFDFMCLLYWVWILFSHVYAASLWVCLVIFTCKIYILDPDFY